MTTCWVITDGAAGNRNQALALAHGLGLAPQVFDIRLSAPWSWLSPFSARDPRRMLATVPDGLAPPWPDLAIGCGRAAAGVLIGLRRLSAGRTRVVQILDPRWRRASFDALVVPEHDEVTGDNVIVSTGGLHRIDDDWLDDGRRRFPAFAALPSPRTAVLIGGAVRGLPFDAGYVDGLLDALERDYSRDGGSFLVTCSRRTPPALAQRLRQAFGTWPGVFWASGHDGLNPYAGLLGWADRIVVTPDSSNLVAEACAVGVPVQVHLPAGIALPGKRRRLLDRLLGTGHLSLLDHALPGTAADRPAPLRELPRIGARLRSRLGME